MNQKINQIKMPVFGQLKNGKEFTIIELNKNPLLWEDAKSLTPLGALVFSTCRIYAPELWNPGKEALTC